MQRTVEVVLHQSGKKVVMAQGEASQEEMIIMPIEELPHLIADLAQLLAGLSK